MDVKTTHEPRPTAVPQDTLRPEEEGWPTATGRPRMAGRVVFVTGGTRGIGAAISRSFASQGAIVAAGYGQDAEHAREFLDQLATSARRTTAGGRPRRYSRLTDGSTSSSTTPGSRSTRPS